MIDACAELVVLGVNPLPLIQTRDDLELDLLLKIKDRAIELKKILDENLAGQIANEVAKRFN